MRGIAVIVLVVAIGCGPSTSGGDAGGGAICDGCPCDGTVLTVCGADIDYVCAHGAWFGHAGLCAMLDAGMPCTDEGRFSCLPGHGVVCCFGQSQEFFDGPCGPSPRLDGAVASCGDSPMEGCPCALDAGTSTCDGSQRWECVTGAWHATSHACGSLCSSGP